MGITTTEKNYLRDDWFVSGSSLDEFHEAVKDLAEHTEHLTVAPKDLNMIPLLKKNEAGYTCAVINVNTLNTMYSQVSGYNPAAETTRYAGFHIKLCPKKKVNEELADECMKKAGAFFAVNEKAHYLSESARGQLLSRVGLNGPRTASMALPMAIAIGDALIASRENLILAVRHDEQGNRKIFGFLSERYQSVPQNVLSEIIDRILADKTLGEAKVKSWMVDHQFTRLYIEFPDVAEEFADTYGLSERNIPGLIVMSSDTGDCSVTVRGTYRTPGSKSYTIVDEVSHRHVGELTADSIIKACDEEVISAFRKLPEALAEKIGNVVGEADVSTPAGRKKNGTQVRSAIRHAMVELGINKELRSKKRQKELEEALCAEVNDSVIYTEYDLAQIFLGLPGRLDGICQSRKDQIARCCGKAPFIHYTPKRVKKAEEDNAEIVLLPGEAV